MLAKIDYSDVTSSAPSSPASVKTPLYYVLSPPSSHDSHDGDKSSSSAARSGSSLMDSPTHPSSAHRDSSSSRITGTCQSSSSSGTGRKRNGKFWRECDVIDEERTYEYYDDDDLKWEQDLPKWCRLVFWVMGFTLVFSMFCLILWGSSKPYRTEIKIQSVMMHNFNLGSGTDFTGVPTWLLTINCSVKMMVHNPATYFGIHVSSRHIDLRYSQITVASGQLRRYYQPRTSHRIVTVNVEGDNVVLYGTGPSMAVSDSRGTVAMTLAVDVRSQGNILGKLVKSRHRRHGSCPLIIDPSHSEPIHLQENSCKYK